MQENSKSFKYTYRRCKIIWSQYLCKTKVTCICTDSEWIITGIAEFIHKVLYFSWA